MPDETPADRQHGRPETGPAKEPLRELTLGRPRPSPDPPRAHGESDTPPHDMTIDPESLAARCREKAGAARWAAECQRRIHERGESPDEDAPSDPAMVEWAGRLTDAFYWANTDDPSGSPDISLLDQVGGCFETVAEGLLLVRDAQARRGGMDRALPLLAEAQSALRRSLLRLKAPDDPDQRAAYEWVREVAARHRIFLKRFLRADDLADPEGWPGRLARIEALSGGGTQSQRQRMLLDRLRSDVLTMGEGGGTEESWRAVVPAVEEVVGVGVPPSSREVRDLLLPHIDDLPEGDELPPGFRLVLREIDRYLATRMPRSAAATAPEPSTEVAEAARLLQGKSVLLIGGIRRPEAQEALRKALALGELIWIETREHESIDRFEPYVARPEVALVLLAIRWSSHSFGDVKRFCDRHGKPMVRLPGGLQPEPGRRPDPRPVQGATRGRAG
jgi:hypothetical protein